MSVAKEAENCVLEALRAWARVKREEVRFTDSVSLAAMMLGFGDVVASRGPVCSVTIDGFCVG